MERRDFWLLRKGWNDKLVYEQTVARRMAYIIHCSLVPKPAKIGQLWPLPGDSSKISVMDSKLRELLKRQKERKKKVK